MRLHLPPPRWDRRRALIDGAIAANRDRIFGADKSGRGSADYERVFNQMANLWVDVAGAMEFAFHERLAETGRHPSKARHLRIYHDHAMVSPAARPARRRAWLGAGRPAYLSDRRIASTFPWRARFAEALPGGRPPPTAPGPARRGA